MGRVILLLLSFFFIYQCNPKSKNLGHELELLRIQTLKNSDAFENIVEFDHTIDAWNNIEGKKQADSFFIKLCNDYKIPIQLKTHNQKIPILSKDSLYLEIENPILKNKKIEIPVINFRFHSQNLEVLSTLKYIRNFGINDFSKRKKEIIGKILVIELEEKQIGEFIERSKTSGILGLIIIIKEGNYVPCYQYQEICKFPILGLSQDDGFFLIESLEKYPNQFIKILVKQDYKNETVNIFEWEKNQGKEKNLYVVSTWKSSSCNKSILSSVTPSMILLDVAKTLQNFYWDSQYNLIFNWSNDPCFVPELKPHDKMIKLENLTEFMGWNYPKKESVIWKQVQKHLSVYKPDLIFHSQSFDYTTPIIPIQQKTIINTDSESLEWIHKGMIMHSLGMLSLSIYLLSSY